MATTNNSATNNVPIFGCPGTITPAGGSALSWILTGITVTPGSDIAELRDGSGMIVSRTHYNLDGSKNSRSATISINAVPISDTAPNALTAGALIDNGTVIAITNSTVPGANGSWEVTSMTASGTNTDHVTVTLNGVWSVGNA